MAGNIRVGAMSSERLSRNEATLAASPLAPRKGAPETHIRRGAAAYGGRRERWLDAEDPMLAGGFHAFEPTNGWRWTAGEAMLPAVLFSGLTGPVELRLDVKCTTSYLLDGAQERRRAA